MSLAALVRRMSEAGAPPEAIALAIEEIEGVQASLDARRTADRDRKRSQREAQKSANVTGHSGDSPETVRDNPSPQSPPLKAPPHPLKITPPLTPQPEDLSAEPTDHPLTVEEVIEGWNHRMVPQGFPPVKRLTETRRKQIKARLRENTVDDWQIVLAALERSAFCKGENAKGWRADFDFMLQPKSFTKLLEGSFDH